MSEVFDLGHVLELVVDSLDDGAISKQDLVGDDHECTFHVVPEFGKELYAVTDHEQFLEQPLAYEPLVPDEFPGMFSLNAAFLSGSMSSTFLGQHEAEQFPLLVADKEQFEVIEPPH